MEKTTVGYSQKYLALKNMEQYDIIDNAMFINCLNPTFKGVFLHKVHFIDDLLRAMLLSSQSRWRELTNLLITQMT